MNDPTSGGAAAPAPLGTTATGDGPALPLAADVRGDPASIGVPVPVVEALKDRPVPPEDSDGPADGFRGARTAEPATDHLIREADARGREPPVTGFLDAP
ncbi:hypothetical protein [Nocardiopsis chromatogenes]|uniref:hypothetical protein n=1 Tax=Nocardiopsis chromatogenes TaxID=280239 RepID=UPI000349EA3E|nr:hypothetical protein [Nocardiopsis chromatogenes]